MGKSTISMAIFNSYVKLPEGNLRSLLGFDFLYDFFVALVTRNFGDESSRFTQSQFWVRFNKKNMRAIMCFSIT